MSQRVTCMHNTHHNVLKPRHYTEFKVLSACLPQSCQRWSRSGSPSCCPNTATMELPWRPQPHGSVPPQAPSNATAPAHSVGPLSL